MKNVVLSILLAVLASGCASNTPADDYREASFELCNTDVDIYSHSDDGRIRIGCSDGSKFALNGEDTLEVMRDINIEYCDGSGLGKFNESRKYYSFKCKSGTLLSIKK